MSLVVVIVGWFALPWRLSCYQLLVSWCPAFRGDLHVIIVIQEIRSPTSRQPQHQVVAPPQIAAASPYRVHVRFHFAPPQAREPPRLSSRCHMFTDPQPTALPRMPPPPPPRPRHPCCCTGMDVQLISTVICYPSLPPRPCTIRWLHHLLHKSDCVSSSDAIVRISCSRDNIVTATWSVSLSSSVVLISI